MLADKKQLINLYFIYFTRTMKQKLLLTWLFLLSFSLSMLSQIQIGSGNLSSEYIPINARFDYAMSQQIVLKSEYNEGEGVAGNITKVKWFVNSFSPNSTDWNLWDVYIGHTTKTSFSGSSDFVALTESTLVFSGTINPTAGQWMEVVLTTPFNYDGLSNLIVTVVEKKLGFTSIAGKPFFKAYTATDRGLYAYQDSRVINTTDLTQNGGKTRTSTVAQLQFEGQMSACLRPSNLLVNSIESVQATAAWTVNATNATAQSYELRTDTNVGTTEGRIATGTLGATASSFALTSLLPDTVYYFYVRSVCGANDSSFWQEVRFRTTCAATAIPYTVSLDDITTPNVPFCLLVEDTNNDGKKWITYAKPTNSGFSDAKVMGYPYHSTNVANDWVFTQGLNLVAGQSYRISFKYRDSGSAEKLRVSYGALAVSTAMTTELFTITTGTTQETIDKTIDFTPTTTGIYYIGFQAFSDRNKNILYVGDVKVETTPTCFVPRNLVVNTNAITPNSVDFSWSVPEIAPVNGYTYEIRTAANPGDPIGLVTQGNIVAGQLTAAVNGLIPSTEYTIYVKSVCAAGDTSIWTPGKKFTTLCDPPVLTSTTNGIACGFGEVTLQALYNKGIVRWYQTQTSSTLLGTGNTFVTPEINETKSYWVDSTSELVQRNVGKVIPATNSTFEDTNAGIVFNIFENITLTGADIYATVNGVINVKITNSAGTELYSTGDVTILANGITTPTRVPMNFKITPGTGYRMLIKTYSGGVKLVRESSNVSFPYLSTDNAITLTGGYYSGASSSYYYFYNIGYEKGCTTARTEVIATVNEAPALTLSSNALTICQGQNSTAVTLTAGATDYDTYQWIPATGVSGTATTGWVFSPAETTEYTLLATQSNGLCKVRQKVNIVVNAIPTLVLQAEQVEVCLGSVQELKATNITLPSTGSEAIFGTGTQRVGTTSYPNTLSAYYGGVKHQLLYTKEELLAKGLIGGSQISSLAFELGDMVTKECKDFTIRIGSTTRTVMTTGFVPSTSLTTVYSRSFTPSTTGYVLFAFTTAYTWDGESNLIIETVHNAGNGGNGDGTTNRYTTTTFPSVYYGAKDSVTPAGVVSFDALETYSTSGSSANRPNIKFGYSTPFELSWAPLTGLYQDQEGTIPYTGDSRSTVYVKPIESTSYTATMKNTVTLCTTAKEVAVEVVRVGTFTIEAQAFCDAVNVEDIAIAITGDGQAKWYTSITGTMVIANITQTGTYYVELVNGICKTERQAVQIEVIHPVVPVAEANQSLCEETTLADLVVEIETGFERRWYASETATTTLPATTVLTNESTYYVSSYYPLVGCESNRVAITAHLSRTPAPQAQELQKFCLINTPTIASLAVTGAAVKWYNAPEGGTVYLASTPLQDGQAYYATQTLNNCESDTRTLVNVIVEDILQKPIVSANVINYTYGDIATVLEASLTTGDELVWYLGNTGEGSINAPTPLTNAIGTTSYWVSQRIINGCESERVEIKVHVTPAVLNVVATAQQTKVYGNANTALTYTVDGFKFADTTTVLSGSLARETGENVGAYAIELGTLAAANYTLAFTSATFTITPAELRINANNLAKVYGDAEPALTYTVEGYKLTDNASIFRGGLVREVGENVGHYAITQGNLSTLNYTINFTAGIFNITPAELVVTTSEVTKVYGDIDPTLTYTVDGLKNNDTNAIISGALTREVGENVGRYLLQQGTLVATPNYQVRYVFATLSITPATLSILPLGNQNKIYGQSEPILNYTAIGFKFNDTTAVISGLLGRVVGEGVRTYRYAVGSLVSQHANYQFAVDTQNTFEIKPAPIEIIVTSNQQKLFGTADPVFRFTVEGLQFDDRSVNAVSGNLSRVAGEAVGTYLINRGSLVSRTNYYIASFVASTFEIVRTTVSNITLPSKTFIYDGTAKSLTIEGNLEPNASVTYVNNSQTEVGTYLVKARIDYGPNFEIKELEAELKIVKAEQVINFERVEPIILEDTPSLQLNARASSGLPISYTVEFENQENILTLTSTGLVTPLSVGSAIITAHQAGNGNYLAAESVFRKIVINSNGTEILELLVDGVSYGKVGEETHVLLDCAMTQTSVALDVVVSKGTKVSPNTHIVVDVTAYGVHKQEIEVISQDGTQTKKYVVIIEKRLPAENIIYQKYENVLLVNNNPTSNGGYTFTKYEWYKNNELIGTDQAYSAGDQLGNKLDPTATYHAVLTLKNGTRLTTCPVGLTFESAEKLQVYPNPVHKTQALNVVLDSKKDYENTYIIYNVLGQVIAKGSFNGNRKEMNLPTTITAGSYFLVLKSEGKHQSVQFIVRE